MSRLRLALLGTPEVRLDDHVVLFRTRKALALLAYLAVQGGRHSREQLTALLWPESDATSSRTLLRTTLAHLRRALGGGTTPGSTDEFLHATRDVVWLDPQAGVDLDLETLAAIARAVGERGALLAQLKSALACYRGEFMAGFVSDSPALEGWITQQREVCHRHMDQVFDRLSQWQSEAGDLHGALTTVVRWVEHDSLHESAQCRLMQLQFATGDRAAALRTYVSFKSHLWQEVHTEPAPETIALAERIRRNTASPVAASSQPEALSAALAPDQLIKALPLVGRAGEFARLIAVFHTARRHAPQVVVLEGEAGIGKTRLAHEFLHWATAEGADTLQGLAFETGGRLPYQPMIDALRRRIEHENAPDDLLSDTWLAEISRLLPELRERYPDLPPATTDETTARSRLFEAVTRLLQNLAQRAPVVVCVDDVQWADAASLDLLQYAARRWTESNTPLLLVLNLRLEDLNASTGSRAHLTLADWLAALGRDVSLTRLRLSALTPDNTLQLIHALAGIEPEQSADPNEDSGSTARQFSQWLTDETDGQPFYIVEWLRALLEQGKAALRPDRDGRWVVDFGTALHAVSSGGASNPTPGALPSTVREMIRVRLNPLSANAAMALIAVAVLGDQIDFDRLCRVADLSESAGLAAMDELLSRGVLSERQARYFFSHDKIREFVYSEAGETRRRVLHRRALETLESSLPPAPPAVLVRHALAAGQSLRAFSLSLAAGDEAMRLFAVRNAIEHYERARQLVVSERPQAFEVAALNHLYFQLGRAHEYDNDLNKAGEVYAAMFACAETIQARDMQCGALVRRAFIAANNGFRLDDAAADLRAARHLAEGLQNQVMLAEIEYLDAQLAHFNFDPATAIKRSERAMRMARSLRLGELTGRSIFELAYCELMLNQWHEAEAHAKAGLDLPGLTDNLPLKIDLHCVLARSLINRGLAQEGIRAVRDAHATANEINHSWAKLHSTQTLVAGLLDAGNYGEALTTARHTQQTLGPDANPFMPLALGTILRAMLAFDQAKAVHLRALEIGKALTPPYFAQRAAAELCADCVMTGAWDEACDYAHLALGPDNDASLLCHPLVHWYKTGALLRTGDIDRARATLTRFGELVGDNPRYRIADLRAKAVVAEWHSDGPAAIEHLVEAARLAEKLNLPGELWQICARLRQIFARQGDASAANAAGARGERIVRVLADSIDDMPLRAVFLSAAEPELKT